MTTFNFEECFSLWAFEYSSLIFGRYPLLKGISRTVLSSCKEPEYANDYLRVRLCRHLSITLRSRPCGRMVHENVNGILSVLELESGWFIHVQTEE